MKGAMMTANNMETAIRRRTQTPPRLAAASEDLSAISCFWSIASRALPWASAWEATRRITKPEMPPPSMDNSSIDII